MRRLIAIALLAAGTAACTDAGDEHSLARQVIASHCAACHTVPGVREAQGKVGPSLEGIGGRQMVGGRLPNSRANMLRWITHAQSVSPGSAMPDIELTQAEADAVADYLFTLD